MKNKPVYLLGIIALFLAMMACSVFGGDSTGEENVSVEEPASSEGGGETSEPTDAPPVAVSSLCDNAYYPVVEGGTWSYNGTSSETEDYSMTNTISSVRSDGFTVTVEFDEVTLTQEWACTPDGLLALESGGGGAGTVTAAGVSLVIDTQNATGITYPTEILPGSTWQHTLDYTGTMDLAGEIAEAEGNTIYNYTAIGVESVSVPAGTFEAMKVEVVTTVNIKATFQGATVPVTFTSTTTSWFAQGVGWVKSDSVGDFGGISTTDTVELVSYNIP